MTAHVLVLLAGFGYTVSQTHTSCGERGLRVNTLARRVIEREAEWTRAQQDNVSFLKHSAT